MAIFDTKHQRAAWLLAILGIIIVIAMLPYASGLLAVPVLYVAVAPLCERLVRLVKSRPIASGITVVIVVIGLVLPLAWLVTLLVGQAQDAASGILKSSLLERLGTLRVGNFSVGPQLKQASSDAVSFIAGGAFSLLGAATRVTINVLLALFGLYYLLLDPPGAWRGVRPFLPFSDDNVTALGERFAAVTQATIIGTGVAALIQGVSMYFAFTVFGLENAIFWAAVVV
ncbi:MAG: AI-2E family transporter, partial [Gemmatimonadota bacterium]